MEYYEIEEFCDRIDAIENFLIVLAATESDINAYGLGRVENLDSYDTAIACMKAFQEDFTAFQRHIARPDPELNRQINLLDSESKLPEQISLVLLNLRVHSLRKPRVASSLLEAIIQAFAISGSRRRSPLFKSEEVSLQKIIVNLGRLRSLAKLARESLSRLYYADDEILKPSNLSSDKVISLIETAEQQISELLSIPLIQRQRIISYLREAKQEASTLNPPWKKIIGVLVVVATITGGIADAPAASKTIHDAINYILGDGVEKPPQNYFPRQSEHPALPSGQTTMPTVIAEDVFPALS